MHTLAVEIREHPSAPDKPLEGLSGIVETRGRLAGRIMASEGHFYPPRYTEGEVWAGVRTTPPSVAQTGRLVNPMNSPPKSENPFARGHFSVRHHNPP